MFLPLTNIPTTTKFLPIPSRLEGRCRDACSAGRDAAPAGGELTWLAVYGRLWVSVRPRKGPATEAGWTGTGGRGEIAARIHVPGSADQGFKTPRWSAERRCRVPLFPGDPGSKPRPLPSCAFRRFTSLSFMESEGPEPPTHADHLRARMTLAPKA